MPFDDFDTQVQSDELIPEGYGEDTAPTFEEALQLFIDGVNRIKAEAKLFHPTKVELRSGQGKYLALDNIEFNHDDVNMEGEGRRTSVFAFIAAEDSTTKGLGVVKQGDVLKPASYKKPAKHARGNIFDEWNGLRGADGQHPMQWTGPHYL